MAFILTDPHEEDLGVRLAMLESEVEWGRVELERRGQLIGLLLQLLEDEMPDGLQLDLDELASAPEVEILSVEGESDSTRILRIAQPPAKPAKKAASSKESNS